jgi:hypothetical protein
MHALKDEASFEGDAEEELKEAGDMAKAGESAKAGALELRRQNRGQGKSNRPPRCM